MNRMTSVSAETLLELFRYPIRRLSQLTSRSDEDNNISIQRTWGGSIPVFVFEFEDGEGSYLYVSSSDKSLLMHIAQVLDHRDLAGYVNEISPDEGEEINEAGLFDLDSVVCPVPHWERLSVTKSVIIGTLDATIVGLCVQVNLGIRIGIFVSPYSGATLSFNDSCDEVVRQAKEAEKDGLVQVFVRQYPGKDTPKEVSSIDWFDWLRQ